MTIYLDGQAAQVEDRGYRIALASCPGLDPSSLRKLVRGLSSARAVWNANANEWLEVCRLARDTVTRMEE